jgi:tetratricopeptide (TPR) repeat protein
MDRSSKRTVMVACGVAMAGALAWGGVTLRAAQEADRTADAALKLLSLPLERAPELAKLPSARALALIDTALELRNSERLSGLHAWASALDAAQKGKPEDARTLVSDAQKRLGDEAAPVRAELSVLEGVVALQQGDVEVAGRAARMALRLDAKNQRAHVLAVDVAIELKEAGEALAQLDALGLLADKQAGLLNRRGLALEQRGELEAARAAFERAGMVDATFAQGHINVGRLMRDQGRHVQAEAAFGRAVTVMPNDSEAWLGRGLSRIAQGDLVGGAFDLEQSRALAPAQSAPLVALADLDIARGERASAIDRYRAALLLEPGHALAWLKLGNAQMRNGDYSGAKAAYESAIKHDGKLAAAHNGLGAARMALGDNDGALAALSTAVKLDGRDPNPQRNLELLRTRMQ